KEWQQIKRIVNVGSDHRYRTKDDLAIKRYIKDLGTTEGASTKKRSKPVAFYKDAEDTLSYLWRCDEYQYQHPRIRIQITWSILLEAFYGLRPGEMIESSTHRGSNEGIHYGDITLALTRHEGALRYQIEIRLRNRKFKRGLEGEERFLEPTAPSRGFLMREDKKILPVCRSLEGAAVSNTKIVSASSLGTHLKDLGLRCGYKDPVSPYAFRRGFANGIEGNVSAQKTRRLLGHSDDSVFRAYSSSIVGIHTQNVVRGLPADQDHMDFVRGIAFHRDLTAPKPHRSLLTDGSHRPLPLAVIDEAKSMLPKTCTQRAIIKKARAMQFERERKEY
ncbi:hypothetical protein K458DRAFT_256458, partial [Lentithecium fluviatile CBS 122367]